MTDYEGNRYLVVSVHAAIRHDEQDVTYRMRLRQVPRDRATD